MIPCIHDYIGRGSRISCRLCDEPSPCEKRTHNTFTGRSKYPVKSHYFKNGVCEKCGMYQFKIGKYKPMEMKM